MNTIESFKTYLTEDEKSALTREKYVRDAQRFLAWLGDRVLTKSRVLEYKAELMDRYAVASVNFYLFFHTFRDSRARMGKISRRPASMSKLRTSLDRSE